LTFEAACIIQAASGLNAVARPIPRHFAQALHFARAPGRGLLAKCFLSRQSETGGGIGDPMSNVTFFGLSRGTFVKVAGLILTVRNVDYHFPDTEEMYLPVHLERHPFGRVPALPA
jgi:hypothetical protein